MIGGKWIRTSGFSKKTRDFANVGEIRASGRSLNLRPVGLANAAKQWTRPERGGNWTLLSENLLAEYKLFIYRRLQRFVVFDRELEYLSLSS